MEMERVTGLRHVRLSVPCVADAVRFYCQGLGLALVRQDDMEAVITTPDGIAFFVSAGGKGEGDTSGITHICLNTFDVDVTFERALALGAVPSRESDLTPTTYKNLRMAFVRTPSGEEIEFWGIMRPNGSFGEPMPGDCYVKHFVHVAMTVPDMQESIRFYESLGARLKVDWEWGCSMRLDDMRELELFTGGHYVSAPKTYKSFAFFTGIGDRQAKKSRLGPAGETIEFVQWDEFARNLDGKKAPDRLPDLFLEAPEV